MYKYKKERHQENNNISDINEAEKDHEKEISEYNEKGFIKCGRLFKKIWSFFTNPGMILGVFKFQRLDHIYETFLRSESLIKLLALVVAIVLAINIRYAPTAKERYSVDINSYPLTAYYDTNKLVVEGLPDTVDVTLVGDKTQVDIAKVKSNFEIYANLNDLAPGTHKINLGYSKLSNKLDIKIDPSTIVVTIMSLTEADKTVSSDLVNTDQIDEIYVLSEPELSHNTVKIKGPQSLVDEIASVKAIIDVSDLSKLSDYEAPVFAYDKYGNKLDVEIKPSKVNVSIEVTTPSKVVPIESVITGNAPDGYSISELVIEPAEIQLYGEETILELVETLPVQVDLYQLDENNEAIIKLEKPANVHKMDVETVKVKVKFEETQTRILEDIEVELKNLDSKYHVQVKSVEDALINLTLTGAKSKLDSISSKDVNVSIDLSGYTTGEYQVPIIVDSIEGIMIEPSRTKVSVIITN